MDAPDALNYRSDVDGLRAVAVLGVLFFHAELGFTGGYAGVDVFFVISGFLITGLLRKTVENGSFSLPEFWHRRLRRLLPAVSALVFAVLVGGVLVLLPEDLELLAKSTTAQAVLGANFYFWQQAGYFGPEVETMPLLHTWSLAVEEQFYLLYPLPFAWLLRKGLRRATIVLALVFVASLALSAHMTIAHPSASFYLLPTRAWELLTGALLALGAVPLIKQRWAQEAASWLGAAAIAFAFFAYDSTTHFPGLAALVPCLGTAAIVHANVGAPTTMRSVLSWRPFVFIGLISYSLYLWHWPLLVYLRYVADDEPTTFARLVALAASVLIAALSWRFIETPIRRKQILGVRRSIFMLAGGLTALPIALSMILLASDGLPQRFSREALALGSTADEGEEDEVESNQRRAAGDITRGWREMKWGEFDMTLEDVRAGRLLVLGDESQAGNRPHFVLWGDSHARSVLTVVDALAKEHGVMGYAATASATIPLQGTWRPTNNFPSVEYNQAVLDFIAAKRPKHVILVSRWTVNVLGREDGRLDSLIVDDEQAEATVDNAKAAFRRGLERTLSGLASLDLEVWIMKPVPLQRGNVPRLLARAAQRGKDLSRLGVELDEHRERQAFVNGVFDDSASARVHVLDPDAILFDDEGYSTVRVGDKAAYRDRHHLSEAGAMLLAPMFAPLFADE